MTDPTETLTVLDIKRSESSMKINGQGDYMTEFLVLLNCDKVWRRVRFEYAADNARLYYIHKGTRVFRAQGIGEPAIGTLFQWPRATYP